jgi:hypothetical protein
MLGRHFDANKIDPYQTYRDGTMSRPSPQRQINAMQIASAHVNVSQVCRQRL